MDPATFRSILSSCSFLKVKQTFEEHINEQIMDSSENFECKASFEKNSVHNLSMPSVWFSINIQNEYAFEN